MSYFSIDELNYVVEHQPDLRLTQIAISLLDLQAQRTPNTIHEEHVPVARTMTYKDPDGNEDNDC